MRITTQSLRSWAGLVLLPAICCACKPEPSDADGHSSTSTDTAVSSSTVTSTTEPGNPDTSTAGTTEGEQTPPHDGKGATCGDGKPQAGEWCFSRALVPGMRLPLQVADFNYDYHLDVLEKIGVDFVIWFGDGNGAFAESSAFTVPPPWAEQIGRPLAAEFDGAPGADIATLGSLPDQKSGNLLVLRNDGTGKVFTPQSANVVAMNFLDIIHGQILDLNGDGLTDIVGTSSFSGHPILQPFKNTGGQFESVPSPLPRPPDGTCIVPGIAPIPSVGPHKAGLVAIFAACNDDDPTGLPLWIMRPNEDSEMVYFEGPQTGKDARAISVGDVDADGRGDIVIWNHVDRSFQVLLGGAQGGFTNELTIGEIDVCQGCPCPTCKASPDYPILFSPNLDGDGRADLILTGGVTWVGMNLLENSTWLWLTTRPLLLGDFNEDGLDDFVAVNQDQQIEMIVSNP